LFGWETSSGHPETAAVLDLDVIRGSSAEFGLQELIWDVGTRQML